MRGSSTIFYSVSFCLFWTVVFIYLSTVQAGLRGLFCPEDDNYANITCQKQCSDQHGSRYGMCGKFPGDFNCYCSPPLPGLSKKSHACVDQYDTRYDLICRAGCQCGFGAVTGVCNYQKHTCECQGQKRNFRSQKYCPFKTYNKLAEYVNSLKAPGFYFPLKNNGNDGDI